MTVIFNLLFAIPFQGILLISVSLKSVSTQVYHFWSMTGLAVSLYFSKGGDNILIQ